MINQHGSGRIRIFPVSKKRFKNTKSIGELSDVLPFFDVAVLPIFL